MDPCELRNTLPQTEDRWDASSAQSWAGYPPGLGKFHTLPRDILTLTLSKALAALRLWAMYA